MLDGIFESLVEGTITNDSYYITEAEVMEEMEKLDRVESSVNLPEDPYDACYESMLINQQNYHNVLMSIALEEMNYYSSTGMEMVYEGGKLNELFSKVKLLVDKGWVKIRNIYEKVIKTISTWVMSDAKLAEKYKKEIQTSTDEQRTIRSTFVVKNDEVSKTGIYKDLVDALSKVITTYDNGKNAKELVGDTDSTIVKKIFTTISYDNCSNTEDFNVALKHKYGTYELVDKHVFTPDEVIKELKEGKATKNNIHSAYKAAKYSVAQYKAIIEKTKKQVEKETKKSIDASNKSYTFSNLTKGCNTCMTILSILQREQVKACNIYHKNCRKVANNAIRKSTSTVKTEESYNFGSSYGNLTNEFSFIR